MAAQKALCNLTLHITELSGLTHEPNGTQYQTQWKRGHLSGKTKWSDVQSGVVKWEEKFTMENVWLPRGNDEKNRKFIEFSFFRKDNPTTIGQMKVEVHYEGDKKKRAALVFTLPGPDGQPGAKLRLTMTLQMKEVKAVATSGAATRSASQPMSDSEDTMMARQSGIPSARQEPQFTTRDTPTVTAPARFEEPPPPPPPTQPVLRAGSQREAPRDIAPSPPAPPPVQAAPRDYYQTHEDYPPHYPPGVAGGFTSEYRAPPYGGGRFDPMPSVPPPAPTEPWRREQFRPEPVLTRTTSVREAPRPALRGDMPPRSQSARFDTSSYHSYPSTPAATPAAGEDGVAVEHLRTSFLELHSKLQERESNLSTKKQEVREVRTAYDNLRSDYDHMKSELHETEMRYFSVKEDLRREKEMNAKLMGLKEKLQRIDREGTQQDKDACRIDNCVVA